MLQPGDTLGRYQVERELGRGGMGVVFLAFDTTLERQLAIKIMAASDGSEASHTRLLLEARSASGLNHPNICTIYEVGVHCGSPFIAMEFVDGRSVAQLLETGPLPLDRALRYGIEAADALAHAHDRGVVHRDLKAANAVVSSSGRLKLVDFGLAQVETLHQDVTRASGAGDRDVAGTPYAMAPEQLQGARVDGRADIWALGVLLHQMLAGAHPFAGRTAADLFSSILRDAPALLPAHVSSALREVVQRCLAKDPAQRYQRAADVRLVLEAMAAGSQRQTTPLAGPTLSSGPLQLPPILVATAPGVNFVGRERERERMAELWQRAKAGQRQVLLLGGEPGVGKTRLSLEFARRCGEEGATVLVGHSAEEALVAYQPFVEALEWFARACPDGDLRAHLEAIEGGGELVSLAPSLLRRVADIPAPQAMSPDGQRYRLFEAVARFLIAVSTTRPVLVVFDDLHWADKPSLLMLRHLVRASSTAALCIVGTYRESELGRTHPLAEMLADFRREQDVTRLSLQGLDEPDVNNLVTALGGADVAPAFAQAVFEGTAGNPFFVTEVMRHLRDTGAIPRTGESARCRDTTDLGLPEGIKEVIGRRLSRVSEACSRALSLAAVIGREFDVAVLEAIASLSEDALLDAMDEAVGAHLIGEVPAMPGRFSFTHGLIRETLYGELTSPRRVRLHRRVGEALERLGRAKPTLPLAELAYHFTQAAPSGPVDMAVDYATRAGDRAADTHAPEEAARYYEMALQSLEFTAATAAVAARRLDLHTRRARAFGALAQWAFEKRELEHALRYLQPDETARHCEIVLELATASFWLLDIPSTERLATEALALAEQLGRPTLTAEAIAWLARCRQAEGDLAAAIDLDRRALARAGVIPTIASSLGTLTLYLAGRMTEAVEHAALAADIARHSQDAALIMYSLMHHGLSLGGVGRYAEAAAVFEEVRQFGRKHGVLPLLARATCMCGGVHLSAFDFEGAEALQLQASDIGRRVQFAPAVVSAGIDLLLIHARRQQPERAVTLLSETAGAARLAAGSHAWLWQLRLAQARAELALARGELPQAIAEATGSIRESQARGRPKYATLGLIARARALDGTGQTHDAIRDARLAVDIARPTGDPASLLMALDVLLTLDGSDGLLAEAHALTIRMHDALPDDTMRVRFSASEIVRRIERLSTHGSGGSHPATA